MQEKSRQCWWISIEFGVLLNWRCSVQCFMVIVPFYYSHSNVDLWEACNPSSYITQSQLKIYLKKNKYLNWTSSHQSSSLPMRWPLWPANQRPVSWSHDHSQPIRAEELPMCRWKPGCQDPRFERSVFQKLCFFPDKSSDPVCSLLKQIRSKEDNIKTNRDLT